jgi:signal transduction histidine kinase
MPESLLDVGLSACCDLGTEADIGKVAEMLVSQALNDCRYRELPVRLALLLATEDWSDPGRDLPRHVRNALRQVLHRDVPLIGGCMAKVFCSSHPNGFVDHGVALALYCSHEFWAAVDHVKQPFSIGTDDERRRQLEELVGRLEGNLSPRLGASADRYILAMFPGISSEADGLHMRDGDFHSEVGAAFKQRYPIYGASSANALDATTGYQFADDECLESGVAVGLIESDLTISTAFQHPFEHLLEPRVSVDKLAGSNETGTEVDILDQEPAADRLQTLRDQVPLFNGQPVFGLRSAGGFRIVLALGVVAGTSGRIRLDRKVSIGDRLYCMQVADSDGMAFYRRLVEGILDDEGARGDDSIFLLGFVCRALYRHYPETDAAWRAITAEVLARYPHAKILVGLSAAEFAHTNGPGPAANHASCWLHCSVGRLSERAAGRIINRRLAQSASELSNCTSSSEVMQKALEGAVSAGSLGGQICLLDRRLRRILGAGFGRPYQPPGSPHEWIKVSEMTSREAPASKGGSYPADLEPWCIPILGDLNLVPSIAGPDPEQREDILALIVRTGLAIFVPDSLDTRFHFKEDAVRVGKFKVQIAIPILGSTGQILGTFQASFPDDKKMDREEFREWVQYVQRLGVVLESIMKRERQQSLEGILSAAEHALQTALAERADRGPFQHFCDEIRRLLGADAVHMRLIQFDDPDGGFELVGYSGPPKLTEIYPKARQVVYSGAQGACSTRVLNDGGVVTSSKAEAESVRWKLAPAERAEEYGQALKDELSRFEATATLPVTFKGLLLGSLIIDSSFEYFFSEEREVLVRECAKVAAQLARVWDRSRLFAEAHQQSGWLQEHALHGMKSQPAGTAYSVNQRFESFLNSICHYLHADWASLFIWHQPSQELVLQVAYRWHAPLDYKARYRLGEGLVGQVAQQPRPLICSHEVPGAENARQKYDDYIEPPEHRGVVGDCGQRIGVRLTVGKEPVGVLEIGYYRDHGARFDCFDEEAENLLVDVGQVISGWVMTLKNDRELRQRLAMDRFVDRLAKNLLGATSQEDWQHTLDLVRDASHVERVCMYVVQGGSVSLGAVSPVSSELVSPPVPLTSFPLLSDLVAHGKEVQVTDEEGQIGELWPHSSGIHTMYAIPIVDAKRSVRGVLAFINRAEEADHPYRSFDPVEIEAAKDVAGLLGAALSSRDHSASMAELRQELATAVRIGAASLVGAFALHDLMRPFTRIQRAVDMIRMFRTEDPEPSLHEIEGAKKQCMDSIERLRQQGSLAQSVVSVRKIVREALRVVDLQIPKASIKLVVRNDLERQVFVNMYSIVAAVVNILTNGLDAMKGEGVLTVATDPSSDDRWVYIRIHNTGPSLTTEEIDRILRSPSIPRPQTGHLGLGLQFARQAVEAAGGTLNMDSPESGGVRVTIALPGAGSTGQD